jgi:hypothetical protein
MKLARRNFPHLAALPAASRKFMTARIRLGIVCALAVAFGAPQARAQTWQEIADSEYWMHPFTVLTMAPDGAWGTATEPLVNRAIANAIASCKAMSGAELGCGAYLTSIRAGWSLGIRCGRENIIVADRDLVEAERRALRRESQLRTEYVRDMPDCVRVATVDPSGRIVPPWPQIESTADVTTLR